MHPYELQVMSFMQKVAAESVIVSDDLIIPAMDSIQHFMYKMYEENPKKGFSLRLSAIGRPLCQQQMQQADAPALQDEWNNPLRMFFGGVIEATAVCILKAAGINIEEEQGNVWLPVALSNGEIIKIPGTFDLIIDGRMWDVKSASTYMFQNKFSSYRTLRDNDEFGYIPQLYGYAKAKGIPPGGWIVVDKSSGLLKFLAIPEDDIERDMEGVLELIQHNTNSLVNRAPFKRCFEEVDETFKKRYTGSKYLESPCVFCKFRYTCWPGLQYLPNPSSTAFEKTYRHYTHIGSKDLLSEDTISEGQGQTITEGSSSINT